MENKIILTEENPNVQLIDINEEFVEIILNSALEEKILHHVQIYSSKIERLLIIGEMQKVHIQIESKDVRNVVLENVTICDSDELGVVCGDIASFINTVDPDVDENDDGGTIIFTDSIVAPKSVLFLAGIIEIYNFNILQPLIFISKPMTFERNI